MTQNNAPGIEKILLRDRAAAELFMQLQRVASSGDFSRDDVYSAGANLMLTAIAQTHSNLTDAQNALEKTMARLRENLASRYDVRGKKKGSAGGLQLPPSARILGGLRQ